MLPSFLAGEIDIHEVSAAVMELMHQESQNK
jgi:hypothetical protein